MNFTFLQKILLILVNVFNIFLSKAYILGSNNGNGMHIHYNFHCFKDYNMICENYEESLYHAVSLYNNENSLLKNVYFEIFVDNLIDNGIAKEKKVINLDSNFQSFSSKKEYSNNENMSKMIINKESVDIVMIFDNFKYNQNELNNIEFSLLDIINDNLIQVLSGLDAYDDNNFYGSIDDTTPKESFLNKINPTMLDTELTRKAFQKATNITDEYFINYLIYNEEALSYPLMESSPWEDTLFYKEDRDHIISNSSRSFTDNYDRIISFGDIHGDFGKLVKILRAAKLIDTKNNWIAKNTALVQVGDLIDRGRDSKKILNLMIKLRKQAPTYDSDIYLILGNHETMNIGGRYDYVTMSEILSYGNVYLREKQFSYHERYGALIRKEMNATVIVGDTLFVHAGLLSIHLENMTIDDINRHFHNILINAPSHPSEFSDDIYSKPIFTDDYFSDYGPTWTRALFEGPEYGVCNDLYQTLNMTNTNRMVVGHSIQRDGKIHTRCDNHLYFIDVGMSKAYFNTLAYLEFKKDEKEIWAKYN